jgi:hypothetical protein
MTDDPAITPVVARRIISRLIDGVAPDEGLDALTAGRERWLRALDEDLESAREGDRRIRIFNGDYGDGKTHLMKLFRARALNANFAVSYVVLSTNTPLNRWDLLYRGLVTQIYAKSRPDRAGLAAVLDPDDPDPAIRDEYMTRAENVRSVSALDPDFAAAIYRFTTKQAVHAVDPTQDLLTLRNWLEGKAIAASVLRSFGITGPINKDRGPRMVASIVACLRHFGFAGVVFLIDEVESTLDQTKTIRSEAYENLRLLIDRDTIPTHCVVVTSTTPQMFTNEEKGFQSYPALWRRVRDFSGSTSVNYRATVVDLPRTRLKTSDYVEIGKRIRRIHGIARTWDPTTRVSDNFIEEAAGLAAGGQLTLFFSPLAIFVKLVCQVLELAEQQDDFAAPTNLAKEFQQVDQSLQQTHKTTHWD